MTSLRCHNCGHANTPDATFCVKCATTLRRDRSNSPAKVFIPPQDDVRRVTQPASANRPANRAGWWLVGMIIVGCLILWYSYLNG